jgi:large subunit ribosomal protein L14
MIQPSTLLNVVDNSGAKKVSCIRVGKGFKKRYAFMGDIIVVSVKSLRKKRRFYSKVLKGDICHALVIRSKKPDSFLDKNENIRFLENAVILLTRQNKILFTRIFGGVPYFIRYTKYMKIISLSSGLIL